MKKTISILCALSIVVCFQLFANAETDVKAKLDSIKPKDFPTKAIEFVVVYKPGGGMDVTARILGKHMEKYIGQRIVVLNKTGGGGLIGYTHLAKRVANDGYTVGIISPSWWTHEMTKKKYAYDDLEPMCYITSTPATWIVSPTGPFKDKSIQEVLEIAKQKPESIKININPGMSSQYTVEGVENAAGVKFVKVPFQGGKPAAIAFFGGHIDIAQLYRSEYRGQLEAGQVKVIAVCDYGPYHHFPDAPTLNDVLGVDNLVKVAWRYAALPKGTPRDRFKYLEAAMMATLQDPECIKDFAKIGLGVGKTMMDSQKTAEMALKLRKIDRENLIKAGKIK